MEESGERIVDQKLRAINKETGKCINIIKRIIYDDTIFETVKYLNKDYEELDYDDIRRLNFDIEINWELRRYQIVKDLLSSNFNGRRINIDEIDNAIFTADLIIDRLKTI